MNSILKQIWEKCGFKSTKVHTDTYSVIFLGYAEIQICSKLPPEKMLVSYFFARPLIFLKRQGVVHILPENVSQHFFWYIIQHSEEFIAHLLKIRVETMNILTIKMVSYQFFLMKVFCCQCVSIENLRILYNEVAIVVVSLHTVFHISRGEYSFKHFEIFPIPYFHHFENLPQCLVPLPPPLPTQNM